MICLVPSNKFLFLLSFVVFDKIMNTRDCTTPLECLFKITHIPLFRVSLFFSFNIQRKYFKIEIFWSIWLCQLYSGAFLKKILIEMEKWNWIDLISHTIFKERRKKRKIRRGREIYNKNQMNLTLYIYKSFWNHNQDNMRDFNFPKRQWFAHFMEYEIKFLIWSRGL